MLSCNLYVLFRGISTNACRFFVSLSVRLPTHPLHWLYVVVFLFPMLFPYSPFTPATVCPWSLSKRDHGAYHCLEGVRLSRSGEDQEARWFCRLETFYGWRWDPKVVHEALALWLRRNAWYDSTCPALPELVQCRWYLYGRLHLCPCEGGHCYRPLYPPVQALDKQRQLRSLSRTRKRHRSHQQPDRVGQVRLCRHACNQADHSTWPWCVVWSGGLAGMLYAVCVGVPQCHWNWVLFQERRVDEVWLTYISVLPWGMAVSGGDTSSFPIMSVHWCCSPRGRYMYRCTYCKHPDSPWVLPWGDLCMYVPMIFHHFFRLHRCSSIRHLLVLSLLLLNSNYSNQHNFWPQILCYCCLIIIVIIIVTYLCPKLIFSINSDCIFPYFGFFSGLPQSFLHFFAISQDTYMYIQPTNSLPSLC